VTATVTQRRQLGTSGPVVSAIGLGFMSFVISTSADEEKLATDLVDRAIDLGITFFDTADVYGPEHSEILLGRAIRGRRDGLTIATKFGGWLTGALRTHEDVTGRRRNHPRFSEEAFKANRLLADEVTQIAAELGVRPSQLALSWVLSRGDDVVPIPGTRRVHWLEENVGALSVSLDDSALARLETLADRVAGSRARRPENLNREAPLPTR
jgi:aryl-alcohol dehydrogenase-like predicted oxidoreductase